MKRIYFGTDGVRGPYGGPLINESFAARLGEAVGRWLLAPGATVLIGRDTRTSGLPLTNAVARGLAAAGLKSVDLGILPTPALAQAVREGSAQLGVVITASHNPADDNGIKFFDAVGCKLTDADEVAIEALLPAKPTDETVELSTADGAEAYRAAAQQLLPPHALLGQRLVVDTAHGATVATTPAVLRALGAEVVSLGDKPNGENINAGVGSEHPEALAAAVLAQGAILGLAHDGDGDRCVLCDELGVILDGDELLTILALDAHARAALVADTLVVTVQSNLGVDTALRAVGIKVVRTAVGDRYVIEGMHACGAQLGGETSGHVICADVSPTGDGLVAALRVLDIMRRSGQPLSQLRHQLRRFPQGTRNLWVVEKRPLETCAKLTAAITELEQTLGDTGRVLVRFSGTEAKLRLLVEAADDARVTSGLAALESAARADLEVQDV